MNRHSDLMDPAKAPDQLTPRTGVRRVNNVPLFILGGVITSFVIIMIMVASDRAEKQRTLAPPTVEVAGNTAIYARELTANQTDGMIQEDLQHLRVLQDLEIQSPPARNLPDYIPPSSGFDEQEETARNEEASRIRMAKMQLLEQAIRARTGVQAGAPRSAGSSNPAGTPNTRNEMIARLANLRQQISKVQTDDPTAAYQARMQQIRGMSNGNLPLPSSSASFAPSPTKPGPFTGGTTQWDLNHQPEAPRSPFQLRAGFVVPATLISGINSDLPGQIMAQISRNVFDTPTGRHLLLPQGSRLIGSYSSELVFGQSRVLVAWQRVIFPDGKALDIGSMPGADAAGYSGFTDQMNNHFLRLFGSAFLMSGVTASIALSQNNEGSDNNSQRASDALSEALGQQLGQVTAQLIAKNMNVSPTLEIRPGYRFNVIVTKDMTFDRPYRSFDY